MEGVILRINVEAEVFLPPWTIGTNSSISWVWPVEWAFAACWPFGMFWSCVESCSGSLQ